MHRGSIDWFLVWPFCGWPRRCCCWCFMGPALRVASIPARIPTSNLPIWCVLRLLALPSYIDPCTLLDEQIWMQPKATTRNPYCV